MRNVLVFVFLLGVGLFFSFSQATEELNWQSSQGRIVSIKEESPKSDIVRLRFAWPENLNFKSRFTLRETLHEGEQKTVVDSIGTGTISTNRHSEGLEIKNRNVKISTKVIGMDHSPFKKKFQKFLVGLSENDTGYIAGFSGELLEVVGLKKVEGDIKNKIDVFFQNIHDSPEKTKAFNRAMQVISNGQLLRDLEDNWNESIGQWAGGELVAGEIFEMEGEQEFPEFGMALIIARYLYVGKVPCNVSDLKGSCVELHADFEVSPAWLEEKKKKFDRDKLSGVSQKKTSQLKSSKSKFLLITEPDTLLPHKSILTKRTHHVNESGISLEHAIRLEENFIYP